MGNTVFRSIGLIARNPIRSASGGRQQRIGQPAVGIVQYADLDIAPLAHVDRREAVDRDDHRLSALRPPFGENGRYPVVERDVESRGAGIALGGRQVTIAGNVVDFALFRHGTRGLGRPVAVIDQSGKALMHKRPVEQGRKPARHRQSARIPGDVAGKRLRVETEIAHSLGHAARRVFADEQAGARRFGIVDGHGFAVRLSQYVRPHQHAEFPRRLFGSFYRCEENSSRLTPCQRGLENFSSKCALTEL